MSYNNLFWGDTVTPNHSQWRIKAENLLVDRDIFHATATKYFPLGALAESRDGRRWRYCEKDGTNVLAKALLVGGCLGTANWQTEVQTYGTAFVVGDKKVTVFVQTTVPAHALIDGYLSVEDGTGEGNIYLIKDNKAGVTATGGFTVEVEIADQGGVRAATVASSSSEITLTKNKYKDVLIMATDAVSVLIGVPLVAVPVNYFFWAQTRGPCPVLSNATTNTIVVGDWVMTSADTAGAVDALAAGVYDVFVGRVIRAVTTNTAECAVIDLKIE